jgi:hypothetical protein
MSINLHYRYFIFGIDSYFPTADNYGINSIVGTCYSKDTARLMLKEYIDSVGPWRGRVGHIFDTLTCEVLL